MEKIINGYEISIASAHYSPIGKGHYKVYVHLGAYKNGDLFTNVFCDVTTHSRAIDSLNEIESYNERVKILYDLIDVKIEKEVQEWIASLETETEEF